MKLNIGAGANVFPYDGWINYDRVDMTDYFTYLRGTPDLAGMPPQQRRVTEWLHKGGRLDYRVHDLRQGFVQHEADSVDAIYCGQMIEHINPIHEAPAFLRECHRMLRPNGVLRLTTPDLDLLIKAYLTGRMDDFAVEQPAFYTKTSPSMQLALIMYGAAGPKCTWDNYEGHMCLYTKESLRDQLVHAGFGTIYYAAPGRSASADLGTEFTDEGMSHSFVMEALK